MYGRPDVVAVGNPAAGAGFTYRIPGSEEQVIQAVCFTLVNAVAVASRIPTLDLRDSTGTPFARVAAPFVTTSGVTSVFTFAVGINEFGANDAAAIGVPLPPLRLFSGMTAVLAVTAMNAADQISNVRLFVRQYPLRPNPDETWGYETATTNIS